MARGFKATRARRGIDFYDDHPISEGPVLAAAIERHGEKGRLEAEHLFEYDQDHYGGVAAVDLLARRARIGAGSRVLDVCAGLAGPARFLASRRGCRVVALELHRGRATSADRLTRRTGLSALVRVVRGDARQLPFRAASFDACISQEGFLHVDDKAATLAECRRVLIPGARVAFTDWVARPRLADRERTHLADWMAATTLASVDGYRKLLGRVGFGDVDAEDITDEWRAVLDTRRRTYRRLREQYVRRLGEARYGEYESLYAFFVGLLEDGKLGGARLTATR